LDDNIQRCNKRYRILESGLANRRGIRVVPRRQHEACIVSSFQFNLVRFEETPVPAFGSACLACVVELKWFGPEEPVAFITRYDSWKCFDDIPNLPGTLNALSTTCDMRVPLTFDLDDCRFITSFIAEEAARQTGADQH